MKRNLLALGIAAASTLSAQFALADASVYGMLDVSYQQLNEDKASEGAASNTTQVDTYKLLSNASRLGFKGDTSINDSLKVIYKLEYEVAPDGDSSTTAKCGSSDCSISGEKVKYDNEFKSRNMYVGLDGDFGTFLAGKNDTPFKLAQNKVDRFNDLMYGDLRHLFVGENRIKNILMYTTPEFSGFSASIAGAPGEQDGKDQASNQNHAADAVSGAVQYKVGTFFASIGLDNDVQKTDAVRAVVQYGIGDLELGAMYQTAEEHDKGDGLKSNTNSSAIQYKTMDSIGYTYDKQDGYLLSAGYTIGDFVVNAQYAHSTSESADNNNDKDFDASMMGLGLDYKLAKSTKVYTYYAKLEGDVKALAEDPTYDTFGVGIQHKF